MEEIIFKRADTSEELMQILNLQRFNIKQSLSKDAIKKEGFVTVSHSFEVLKRMNDASPHILAKADDKVIAYALCMLNSFRNDVPILAPMFNHMDTIMESKGLLSLNYLIMGQICIDKTYRKQGLFKRLYHYFKTELQSQFDAVITEVSIKNTRSLEAHKAVGFQVLDQHTVDGQDWELIIWRWK